MSRLIDADAFKRNNQRLLHCDFPYLCEATLEELIDEEPTVEAVPVKHGEWIEDMTGSECCSECHKYPYDDGEYHIANWHSDFCPNCGADMRGEHK